MTTIKVLDEKELYTFYMELAAKFDGEFQKAWLNGDGHSIEVFEAQLDTLKHVAISDFRVSPELYEKIQDALNELSDDAMETYINK